jgi:diguanylate cyclase (GGDEF)-like protein/PAS domain S-box-containing protein
MGDVGGNSRRVVRRRQRPANSAVDTTADSSNSTELSATTASAHYISIFEALGQSATDLIVILDKRGVVVYANPIAQKVFGVTNDDAVGTRAHHYLHPEDRLSNAKIFASVVNVAGTSARHELRSMSFTGEIRHLEVVYSNLLDDPSIRGIVVNARDVTERHDNVARLQALEERFRLAFEENLAPMSFTDINDQILAVNRAFCSMVGFSPDELIGGTSAPFTYPDDLGLTESSLQRVLSGEVDHERYVKRYLRKDGQVIDVEVLRSPARDADGNISYFVFSERDITEERKLTAQLSRQALYDSITGLANRTLMENQLARARASVRRRGGLNALFLLDLDDFKGVNDTQGHLLGDQLLIGVARRFEAVTRPSDTLCRFGGDEFLYLAEDLDSVTDVEGIAHRLLDALSTPFHFDDIDIEQGASVGVVVWGDDDSGDVDLLQNADVALYEAKRHHRGGFAIYRPSMHEEANKHFMLIQELRTALSHGELELHYQPIVHLPDTKVVGFEGLIRWHHPERGWIPPSEFIPLAERSDTIFEVGAFAIEAAVAAASAWHRECAGQDSPFVCVNLSARQFHSPQLVSLIEGALSRHDLPPAQLVLEITEGVAIANFGETMNTLSGLDRIGVGVALDDFGTGFSSLSYLAKINPRIIKVDQSFVQLASASNRDATLLEAILTLGRNLNIVMLGEGVETSDQFDRLVSLGCDLAQGFLFSRAVALTDASVMVGREFSSILTRSAPAPR